MRFAMLALVSVVATAVLLLPAVSGRDGFPVSSHPMYATTRDAEASFVTAEAFDESGVRLPLGMREIADTDDPLIAETRLRRAAETAATAAAACEAVIDRLGEATLEALDRVEIVRVRHELAAFVAGDTSPLEDEVVASCRP